MSEDYYGRMRAMSQPHWRNAYLQSDGRTYLGHYCCADRGEAEERASPSLPGVRLVYRIRVIPKRDVSYAKST